MEKGKKLLHQGKEQEIPKPKEIKKKKNQDIIKIAYVFVGLFVLLIGNFVYFMMADSSEVINNTYNTRQDLLAERIIRGNIYGNDYEVLAETVTNKDGTESRRYPYDSLFVHIVGQFSQGKTGIELSENFPLLTSNTNAFSQFLEDIAGDKIAGDNVVTTLDVSLQQIAADALGDRKGAVVVLEPDTGKILAMVSKPDYNPNTVSEKWEELKEDVQNESALMNRAAQGLYPPGSTFKLVTALEYMREYGDYSKYEYNCEGLDDFSGIKIRCYNEKHHGMVDLKLSLAKSCNTSFANIGSKLDLKSFRNTCNSLLFNTKLPTSIVTNRSHFVLDEHSDEEEVPQTAIGQGKTQITPLHNAMIVAAIANGGNLMRPYVVDRVETSKKKIVKKNVPSIYGALMTAEEAQVLTEYMQAVVEEGTAAELKNSKYTAAGKTGSAEYNSSKSSHAWFVGFAPAEDPKIVVSVIVEGAGTGSQYAVPIAKQLFEQYLT
nr:penicillin-binding transpeptidase domain-containing protein [Anaeromicropila populeti]